MKIKKFLAGIAAAALVFTSAQIPMPENGKGLIQLTAHAETVLDSGYCGTELRYWLTDDGVLRIAGNDDMTYHPWDHKKVVKVVIEDGVKSICADAFKNCYYLTSVTIPTSVKSIGVNAFAQTQAYFIQGGIHYISSGHGLYAVGSNADITTAVFDDNCVLMCDGICTNRTALRSVKLPSSISAISKNAFNGAGLTEVNIPSNVTRIGPFAFKFCIDMARVSFSDGLFTINTEAFSNCSSLEKITLPKSLSWVDNKAFYDCTSLREVTSLSHYTNYDPDVQSVFGFSSYTNLLRYYYGYFDSKLNSLKNFFPIDDSGSQRGFTWSYSAETSALVINGSGDLEAGSDDVPWEDCRDYIKSVTLLEDVTSVDRDFFYNCKNLVTISLPDSMTEMPCLSGCVSLESVNIPAGVTALDTNCLKDCSSLTELVLSDNTTYIAHDAISGCYSLRSITIPNRECIIYDQKGLPLTLEVICIEGSKAYRWAEENGYTITLYNSDIMGYCGVSYNLNDGILYLSDGKMDDFDDSDPPWMGKEFTEVICENVRYIGRNAFKDCTNIKKITFDTSLAKIGDEAFMDCKELEELNIKTEDAEDQWSLEELGDRVFKNCTSLKTFEAPKTLRKYGEELFYGCTSLEAFYFSPEDKYNGWDDSGKVYDDSELAAYMEHARPSVRMFYGCSSLEKVPDVFDGYYNEEAFAYCTSITSVTITSHVDKGTFKGCTSLKYISFKYSYYVIEESAFENTGFKELKLIESSLYHKSCIESNAFKDCKQLKIVNIPKIIAIDPNAFIGCIALKDINFSGTKADWEPNFGGMKFSVDVTIHTTGDPDFVVTAHPESIVTTTDGGSDPSQGTTTTAFPAIPVGEYSGSCISRIDKPDGSYDEDIMYWAINNGVLTLGGKGAYLGFNEQPWKRYKDEVKKVVIGSDITAIMYKDFADMENLTEVEYQGEYSSLSYVDLVAFEGCDALISLAFPDTVKYITGALYDATNIRSILVENKKCQFGDMLIEGVTIYGYSGSTAEKYAEKYENVYFVTEDQWTGKRPPKTYPEDNGEIPEAQASGTCNGIKYYPDYDVSTTISWTVDGHTLIIDGEGQYYGKQEPPWMEYKDCITKVIIGPDISGIADNEFVGMKNLSVVEYKEGFSSIKTMSLNAFKGCPKLNKLVVPKSAEYLSGEINRMTDDFEITEIYVMNPQCNIELDLNNYWDNDLKFYSDTSIYGSVYYFTERHSHSTELRDGSLWTGYRPPNTKGEVEAEEVYYYTDEDDGSLHSGSIGSRVYWQVKNGVFTISGSGIPYDEIDISECRDFIKTVKIGNEIQELSNSIFADCVNLRKVEIDGEKSELLYFSTSWFKGCTDIEPFTLPATLKEIRVDCDDTDVTEVTVLSRDCDIWASKYAQPLTIRCYSDSKIYKSAQKYDNITVYAIDGQDDNISLGDVNGDGMVDASDASAILVAYAIVSTGGDPPFSDAQTAAADVNGDGKVDATDASTVLVYYSYVSTGGDVGDMKEWLDRR